MPKIANLYLALILILDSKIQDTKKETAILYYIKIMWYATILLLSHNALVVQGS